MTKNPIDIKNIKKEYFALDLEKFKENPEENLVTILEALQLTFSSSSVNFDKLMPLLKMKEPITYGTNEN